MKSPFDVVAPWAALVLSGVLATLGAACGGAAPEPQTPPAGPAPVADTQTQTLEPPVSQAAASSTPVDASDNPERPADSMVPPPDAREAPDVPREIKYVVTPEGLKVEVSGVRLLASAVAVQIARGWGVKVSVKAESVDGKDHSLLSPKNGPMAFAAAVLKRGSTQAERLADSREGEGELALHAGTPLSFSREFPSKGGRVLAIGESLDLEVGLWGVGSSAESRRPVKHFIHVKMKVEHGKPKALVEPPASTAN